MTKKIKVTLKSVQEQFAAFRTAVEEYTNKIRFPEVIVHSTTGSEVVRNEVKGKAIVTIEELIVTARTAEILGKWTVLRVTNGGKSLEILFVTKPSSIPTPEGLYVA